MKYSVTLPILLLLAGCATPKIDDPRLISYDLPVELKKAPEKMTTIPLPKPESSQ